jgi:hypothetical protein
MLLITYQGIGRDYGLKQEADRDYLPAKIAKIFYILVALMIIKHSTMDGILYPNCHLTRR